MAGPLEEKRFSDLCGSEILLQRRSYSDFCREFSITCPKVSLRAITACTCGVWVLAYGLFVLSENTMVLSSAIFITVLGMLFYLHFMKIDQETLLVIGSLGVQLTSFYASGKESTTFIEMSKVKDIVINEAIYMGMPSNTVARYLVGHHLSSRPYRHWGLLEATDCLPNRVVMSNELLVVPQERDCGVHRNFIMDLEGFQFKQKVIYYLCILLRDPLEPEGVSEVVPVFQSSKPRLDCLVEVYRSCQEILEDGKTS